MDYRLPTGQLATYPVHMAQACKHAGLNLLPPADIKISDEELERRVRQAGKNTELITDLTKL